MSVSDASYKLAGRRAVVGGLLLAACQAATPPTLAAESKPASATPVAPADLVVTGGNIYTVDPAHSTATALAVKDGRLVFVGNDANAKRWIGPKTKTEQLDGRLVLPGLIDAHLHPLDSVDLDVCNLNSTPMTLKELSTVVAQCVAHYKTAPGQRLVVHQWSYTAGNQPDPKLPTLRAALDAASTRVEIQLMGNDGHHGAFNSLALAHAKNAKGQTIGLSKATLASEFAAYKPFIGVDGFGEPNGAVNEDARYLINIHSMTYVDLAEVAKAPERVPQKLNRAGITGIMDAMVYPDGVPVYDKMFAGGNLTLRITLAQFYDPSARERPTVRSITTRWSRKRAAFARTTHKIRSSKPTT